MIKIKKTKSFILTKPKDIHFIGMYSAYVSAWPISSSSSSSGSSSSLTTGTFCNTKVQWILSLETKGQSLGDLFSICQYKVPTVYSVESQFLPVYPKVNGNNGKRRTNESSQGSTPSSYHLELLCPSMLIISPTSSSFFNPGLERTRNMKTKGGTLQFTIYETKTFKYIQILTKMTFLTGFLSHCKYSSNHAIHSCGMSFCVCGCFIG